MELTAPLLTVLLLPAGAATARPLASSDVAVIDVEDRAAEPSC